MSFAQLKNLKCLFIIYTGQINIQSQPLMTNQSILQAMATQLQQGGIPLSHQPLQLSASGQSPTILPGQPVYIRTTQIQGQQGKSKPVCPVSAI